MKTNHKKFSFPELESHTSPKLKSCFNCHLKIKLQLWPIMLSTASFGRGGGGGGGGGGRRRRKCLLYSIAELILILKVHERADSEPYQE